MDYGSQARLLPLAEKCDKSTTMLELREGVRRTLGNGWAQKAMQVKEKMIPT